MYTQHKHTQLGDNIENTQKLGDSVYTKLLTNINTHSGVITKKTNES